MNLQNAISKISITPEESAKVGTAQQNLIQLLHGYAEEGIIPSIVETRLIGSYKRKTKISPLNDVDILLLFGKGHYAGNNWHIIDECSYDWKVEDKDETGNISSIRILNTIRTRISQTYPRSEIKRNNEVVNVYLNSHEVGFDLIPCFYFNDVDYFMIPEGSNSTKWKKTNPIKDELILDSINKLNGNKIKDVVKLSKHFFSYKKIKSLRSYHLEACALSIFTDIAGNSPLKDYLAYFYSKLDMSLLESCPDPTNLSGDLSSGLTSGDREKIVNELITARRMLIHSEEAYCEYAGLCS